MQTIEMHLVNYDIIDVCNIVEPETNFLESMEIRGVHNLLADHSQLTPPMVAISNFFYNTCVDQEYIGDNMSLLFQFLKNNTDEDLWTKCLEDYQAFHPLQQGGPLMFILILKRIRDSSESAVLRVRASLEKLKIKNLEGEDVDMAVSLIKTVTELLESH